MELKEIKLIIWDLDDTLWKGTLSEGAVSLKRDFIDFIRNTYDMGIIHSICSKNDASQTNKELTHLNIDEYFVFKSIDWSPKGPRIQHTISTMKLRPDNVLFVDDNHLNLQEAKQFCPNLMIASPEEIKSLFEEAKEAPKTDLKHKRMHQYQLLEKKSNEQAQFSSNEEFLKSCHIHVDIDRDCISELERITDLVQRSNQLNYTKFRQDAEGLRQLIESHDVDTGIIKVSDKFGDYGIIGFFAVKDHTCIHFLFSCRTLGMKIEQWVYMQLNCPRLNVVGEVVSELDNTTIPEWINLAEPTIIQEKQKLNGKILLKGPCDMRQIFSFIQANVDIIPEFTYVGENGMTVEGHNHTAQILTSLDTSPERKIELLRDIPWSDSHMFDTSLTTTQYDFIVLSMLTDGALGVYQHKKGNEYVAFCSECYDLTSPSNWDLYLEDKIPHSHIPFTQQALKQFSNEFNFINNKEGELTLLCLDKLYDKLQIGKSCHLILLLGSEFPFEETGIHGKYTTNEFFGRHIKNRIINNKIRNWATNKIGVSLLCFDTYIQGKEDFLDTINHFTKEVYYKLSIDLVKTINQQGGNIHSRGKNTLIYEKLKVKFSNFIVKFPHIKLFLRKILNR